jgi:hypothetical protein
MTPFWGRGACMILAHVSRSLPPTSIATSATAWHHRLLAVFPCISLARPARKLLMVRSPTRHRAGACTICITVPMCCIVQLTWHCLLPHSLRFRSPVILLAPPSDEQAHHIQQHEHLNQPFSRSQIPGCAVPQPCTVPA